LPPNRERRRALRAEFERLGARDAERLALMASELDLTAAPGSWPPPFPEERAIELLGLAANAISVRRLSSVVGDAASKAAMVVADLRAHLRDGSVETASAVDLAEEIEAALALFRDKIGDRVEVKTRWDSGLSAWGSRRSLAQVWMNLISNALQAMEYRGSLSIETRLLGGRAVVTVEDDGPGIPEDIMPRIFEPFFTTKASGEGLGLGLEICRSAVEANGGSIRAESAPGRTIFTVELPAADGVP
jgi:signal transduction histidine kinase